MITQAANDHRKGRAFHADIFIRHVCSGLWLSSWPSSTESAREARSFSTPHPPSTTHFPLHGCSHPSFHQADRPSFPRIAELEGRLGIPSSPLSSDNSVWAPLLHPPNSFAPFPPSRKLPSPIYRSVSPSFGSLSSPKWDLKVGTEQRFLIRINLQGISGHNWRHFQLSQLGEVILAKHPKRIGPSPKQRITWPKMPGVAWLRNYGAKVEKLTVGIETLGLFSQLNHFVAYVTLAKSQANTLNPNFYIYKLRAKWSLTCLLQDCCLRTNTTLYVCTEWNTITLIPQAASTTGSSLFSTEPWLSMSRELL